jgi:hypothetical protein
MLGTRSTLLKQAFYVSGQFSFVLILIELIVAARKLFALEFEPWVNVRVVRAGLLQAKTSSPVHERLLTYSGVACDQDWLSPVF